jgi:hypothetical protein
MEENHGHTDRACPDTGPWIDRHEKHTLVDILPRCIIALPRE